MKRLQRLKKSLSLLLTFSMIISLFYGMVPVASAADTAGDYVTVHYENDGLRKENLTVVVKDPSGAEVDKVEINDARLTEQDISISLKDPYREIYDIKRVEKTIKEQLLQRTLAQMIILETGRLGQIRLL